MFLTTHAAAGLLIGQYIGHPWTVFGVSFISHFVMDFIPHGDEELYHDEEWRVKKKYRHAVIVNAFDLVGLFSIVFWAIGHPGTTDSQLMLIGIIGSILPDFLSFLFPVVHERMSWLFLVRWFYKLTKPTGLRYFVRAQNWIHNSLHHDIIQRDIPFSAGLSMQVVLVGVLLYFAR